MLLCGLIVFIVSACNGQQVDAGAASPGASFDYATHVGWLHGACLAIANPDLEKGVRITVVALDEDQSLFRTEVRRETSAATDCKALLEGRRAVNLARGSTFYAVADRAEKPIGLGIGIVGESHDLAVVEGAVRGDLDGDGREEMFTECATNEGVSFGIWTDAPYEGDPRWSAYYYLDYDTEPTCPDRDGS